MNIAIFCILIAFLLIYIAKLPLSYTMYKLDNHYDNHYPRDQQARLTGFGKRATAAHYNSFETFPAFGIGTLLALYSQVSSSTIEIFCISFLIFRSFYLVFYWLNFPILRSTSWVLGFFSIIGLFIASLSS